MLVIVCHVCRRKKGEKEGRMLVRREDVQRLGVLKRQGR